jgi:hypothetical protein
MDASVEPQSGGQSEIQVIPIHGIDGCRETPAELAWAHAPSRNVEMFALSFLRRLRYF